MYYILINYQCIYAYIYTPIFYYMTIIGACRPMKPNLQWYS